MSRRPREQEMAEDWAVKKPSLLATRRRGRFRKLWQVPTFLAGIVAILALWRAQAYLRPANVRHVDREIASVRAALDAGEQDVNLVLAKAQKILAQNPLTAEQQGAVHFLIGSAYVLLAEKTRDHPDVDAWRKARESLEKAAELGAPTADHLRLTYRLGKAWYQTDAEPERVIDSLSRSVEAGAESPSEGYRLLTRAYLRLPKPDIRSAIEANKKHLALSTEDDDHLAPARLLQGELLLKVQQRDEARKVLARIARTAPKEIYSKARFLRAQSCQEDKLWSQAAELWEEIMHDSGPPPCDPGRILYYLGLCNRRLERPRVAARLWDSALKCEGDVKQAAALGLGELRLLGKNSAAALESYELALQGVTGPATYRNTLVDRNEACGLVDRGCRLFQEVGDGARCLKLAHLYSKIGEPAEVQQWTAQASDACAQDCRKRAAGRPDGARVLEEANTHAREAGEAYEKLAASTNVPAEQSKWLWLGADRHAQAKNYPQAIVILKKLLSVETAPEKWGQAWYKLAQAYQASNDATNARAAFLKCIEYPGPGGYRARLQLARADIEHGKLDDAEASLRQNLELMRGAPDEEIYEKSLRALAGVLIKRGDHRMAAVRLQELLERYPGSSDTMQTRQQLAECYRRLAAQEEQNLHAGTYLTPDAQIHYRDQRRIWMQMAAAHYQKLVDDLASLQSSRGLSAVEETTFRQAGFSLAECRFESGDYPAAVHLYEELVARYPRRAEALVALKQITRCYWVQRDQKNAVETIKRLQITLKAVSDADLARQPDGQTRQEWEDWLDWATKQ
jgi:tetratricopeptide (TPR) repeat protein